MGLLVHDAGRNVGQRLVQILEGGQQLVHPLLDLVVRAIVDHAVVGGAARSTMHGAQIYL